MNYDESVKYLLGLGNEVATMKLGLENISKLLAALGEPQNNYLKIQIAGTNGKGSTCAFLDAVCRAAHVTAGLYTSPHLVSITERIKINGAEISEKDFAHHATRIRNVGETLVKNGDLENVPTFFEQITAIALTAFAETKIELAILETGLGGRFDATTAAKAEIVAVTPIDLDHQEFLGETIEEIAAEKAAIIRDETKVVIAPQKNAVLKVILARCQEKKVVPIINNCEVFEKDLPQVNFKTANYFYPSIKLSLEGAHQRQNACVAISLAEILRDDFKFEISDAAIVEGLQTAEHRGRLEWANIGATKILFDGAHNVAGAQALKNYLDEFVSQPITLIFGAMRDKDLTAIAPIIFPKATSLILTAPQNSRALSGEELKAFLPPNYAAEKVFLTESVADALNRAFYDASDNEGEVKNIVVITGSLYLVGEAKKLLNSQNFNLPLPQ